MRRLRCFTTTQGDLELLIQVFPSTSTSHCLVLFITTARGRGEKTVTKHTLQAGRGLSAVSTFSLLQGSNGKNSSQSTLSWKQIRCQPGNLWSGNCLASKHHGARGKTEIIKGRQKSKIKVVKNQVVKILKIKRKHFYWRNTALTRSYLLELWKQIKHKQQIKKVPFGPQVTQSLLIFYHSFLITYHSNAFS